MEFFGPGVAQLSIADRATIANMCPEYGATAAFFPVDDISVGYLIQTGEYKKRQQDKGWLKELQIYMTLAVGLNQVKPSEFQFSFFLDTFLLRLVFALGTHV